MKRALIVLGCLFVLVGCNLHKPTLVSLPVELPEHYLQQAAGTGEAIPRDRWWLAFEDTGLNLLMDELFAQNLQIEAGFARLEQARATLTTVRSAQFPSLNLQAEQGRSMQPSFAGSYIGNNQRLAAVASFELDLWGKLAARSKAAVNSEEASYLDLQTLYLSLSSQLADLYYLAVEQRAQLALVDETIASFADTVARVESRYRQGVAPALDLYQTRQNLSAAQASRKTFEANLAGAEHAISILLGHYPQTGQLGDENLLPEKVVFFPAGLPSELIARRPDLQASLRRIEAADAGVAAAIADRFPSISLTGSAGTSRQDFSTGLIKGDFWSLLGSLSAPVFDAGRRKAEVERNRALVREAVAGYQQQVLNAFREVEDALANNRTTEERIARLVETEVSTRASLRLALQRYLYGLTDYLPVLTSQRVQFDTRSRLLAARRQLISDRISLGRAVGGSWMARNIEQRLAHSKGKEHE